MATNDEIRSLVWWQEAARQDELDYERGLREREEIRTYQSETLGRVTIPED